MITAKPNIAVIGSCRVFNPVNILSRENKILHHSQGIDWYTHSTCDALQKIDIVKKNIEVPNELLPLLVHTNYGYDASVFRKDIFDNSDVFIVEISSIKVIKYGFWYLQQWCVRDVLENEDSDYKDRHYILDKLLKYKQNETELKDHLRRICVSIGKPIIFVSHFDVPVENGNLLPERSLIRSTLINFCKDTEILHFDPTDLILRHGHSESLSDHSHYLQSFEQVVADKLYDAILECISK